MRFSGRGLLGRLATRLAAVGQPPHKARISLSRLTEKGYLSAKAVVYHEDLHLGKKVFVDDHVVLFQREEGGGLYLDDYVALYRDAILETGWGGEIRIGKDSSIHPRCQLNAYLSPIHIGNDVMIAPNCACYTYDHGLVPDIPISKQPLISKGGITIEDGAWLGFGVIVLSNVRIGAGAVVGAGSLVVTDIPAGAIAVGSPAKVVKMRKDLKN